MASLESLKVKATAPSYGWVGTLRAVIRLALILPWIFINIPLQVAFILLHSPLRFSFPTFFHRTVVKGLMGMKIDIVGQPSKARPTFFISNHLSYADIPVLSTVLPMSFISRAEVANWPLLGLLAKLQHTVFIDRRKRGEVKNQMGAIKDFLAAGHKLVLFPEGGSFDGRQVMPFKSTLMQAIYELDHDIAVQPITLAILTRDGSQHYYPWYGAMDFPEHVWPFLQAPPFHIRLTFHPPVMARRFADRKALSEYAYNEVIKAPSGVTA